MIYPTRAAVLAAAAGAPLALLVGVLFPHVWYAGLALPGAVVLLALVDAVGGTNRGSATLDPPASACVGETVELKVTVNLGPDAPRTAEVALATNALLDLDNDGRAWLPLTDGRGAVLIPADTRRRGTATIERLWLRWRGGFGLVWKQRSIALDAHFPILPDIRPVRQRGATIFQRHALQGLIAQLERGDGTDFEALVEYRSGMDRRAIDWKQSARHQKLHAKEFRSERNNQIVFAIDCGRQMSDPVAGLPRVDRAVAAMLLTAWVALKLGDRVSLTAFDARPRLASGFVSGASAFAQLQHRAAQIDYSGEETNYTFALTTLATRLTRRSMIVLFTEFTDLTAADFLVRAAAKLVETHLLLVVVLRDEELESIIDRAPEAADDITRAVTAAGLLKDRLIVLTRLRHLGVHVVEAEHDRVGDRLVAAYVELEAEEPTVSTAPGAAVPVNASRFRAAHQAEWERLEALVTRVEKRSIKALDDDDLLAFPLLYRATLSSLSAARATSLDKSLVGYLEQLSTRAYFQLYGVPTSAWRQLKTFFVRGWPLAVQALWRETLIAFALTVAGALVGYLLVRSDPSWFYGMIPEALAGGRDPAASAEALRSTLYDSEQNMLATFATYLFTHNAQIAIFAFALGFAFAVPTALLILYNGLMLGAFLAVFAAKGVAAGFVGWLFIHGTTELFAIMLAGAAGFRIGTAIAFPGRRTRTDAAVAAGRAAATVMAGAVVMLAVAGLLEGIGRQTVTSDLNRYLIGATMLAGWLVYFYLPRRADG